MARAATPGASGRQSDGPTDLFAARNAPDTSSRRPADVIDGQAPTLSIAVINYNYARYLPVSVGSALVQGDHEVIVVDDGSTDDSREIIHGFGERIKTVFKKNGGHSSAVNAAFAAASGDIIIFLDADDILLPGCAAAVLDAWHPQASKLQWGSYTIRSDGARTGHIYPRFTERCTPQWCRTQLRRCSWYEAPMTSGNAWSREFLANVMPLPEHVGSPGWALDDYLHLLAPYFGDVISLTTPLGEHRVHPGQMSRFKDTSTDRVKWVCEDERLRYELVNAFLRERGERRLEPMRWSWHAHNRLMLKKSGDNRDHLLRLLAGYVVAYAVAENSVKSKLKNIVYGLVLAVLPARAAARLIAARMKASWAAWAWLACCFTVQVAELL